MKIVKSSAGLIGKALRSVNGTQEDAIAVLLTLGTEENAQEFFAWCKNQTTDPTPQELFEKAWNIRETNGPWPEETENAERDSQEDGVIASPDEQSN